MDTTAIDGGGLVQRADGTWIFHWHAEDGGCDLDLCARGCPLGERPDDDRLRTLRGLD